MSDPARQIEIRASDGGVELTVKVVPGSSRDEIIGAWGSALRVAVAAPPEAGKANKQLIRLLAASLGVKRTSIAIVQGETRPLKRVHIDGLSVQRAAAILSEILRGRA